MASKYWLKLFHETIYDPKVMMRSPSARLRWYECLCLAGDLDLDGELPSIEHMLFVFRISEEQLLDEFSELMRAGLVVQEGETYKIKNWKKRQNFMDTNERVQRHRDAKQKQEYYEPVMTQEPENQNSETNRDTSTAQKVTNRYKNCNENVTNRYTDTDTDTDKDTDKDTEAEKEQKQSKKTSAPASSPPQFFATGWHDRVFVQVTQIPGIPGGDAPKVFEALEAMRTRFKTEGELIAYLRPYFENWTSRKTKDGRKYSRSNCAWLYDLALAGEPLPSDVHPPGEKPDPDCPKCGGMGVVSTGAKFGDVGFGKLVKCSCVKVREEVKV